MSKHPTAPAQPRKKVWTTPVIRVYELKLLEDAPTKETTEVVPSEAADTDHHIRCA